MADISKEQAVQLAREAGFAYSWSEAAGEALERFAQAAFKLGRNQALEEARQELQSVTCTNAMVLRGVKHAAEIIESLKDNTP